MSLDWDEPLKSETPALSPFCPHLHALPNPGSRRGGHVRTNYLDWRTDVRSTQLIFVKLAGEVLETNNQELRQFLPRAGRKTPQNRSSFGP